MKTPVTPREWAFQIALSTLIAVVAGLFFPEKRMFLVSVLIGLALVSWVSMKISSNRFKNSNTAQAEKTD